MLKSTLIFFSLLLTTVVLLFFPVFAFAQEAAVVAPIIVVPRASDMFGNIEQYGQLKAAFTNYQDQIVERDRLLAERDAELKALRPRGGPGGILDQSVDAAFYLSRIREQKRQIDEQNALLEEKSRELAELKGQLQEADAKYDVLIKEYQSGPATVPLQAGPVVVETGATPDPLMAARLASKIAAIEQLTADLQAERAKFDTAIAAKDKQIAALKTVDEGMVKMKGDMAALNYQVETGKEDIADSQRQIEGLNATIDGQLSKTIALWKVSDENNAQDAAKLRRDLEQKDVEIAQLNKTIAQKDAQQQEAAGPLTEFESRLKEALDVNNDQSAKIENLQTRLKALGQQSRARELSVAMMQAIIDQKNTEYAGEKAELTAVRERLAVAEARIKTSVAQEDLAKVRAMLKSSHDDAAALSTRLEFKDKQIARLKIQLGESRQTIKDLSKDSGKIYKGQVTALTAKLKQAEAQLRQANVQSDPRQLKKALKDSQEQIKALREELKQVRTLVKGNRVSLTNASDSADAREVIDRAQEHIKALQQKLSEAASINDEWRAQYDALSRELQQTKDLLQDCRDAATGMGWIKRQLKANSELLPAGK